MRFVSKFYCMAFLALCGAVAVNTLHAQSVLARADADPSVMTAGEISKYSIHFMNADSVPRINTPRVEGLEFSSTPSTSSYRRIENGRYSIETTMSWSFRATRLGSFTIPGRTVQIKGEELQIPDVEIRIIEPTEEQKSRALLILELPEGPYYVGQALQSRLILLGRRDLHLSPSKLPSCESDQFLHSELNDNQERPTLQYKGRVYNSVIWNIVITPIKAGKTVLQFRQDLELQTVNRDSRFPSIFSMASTQSEPLTIYSDKKETEILPLPDASDEQNFSGAIGNFEVTTSLGSTEMVEGEPTTLTLTLTGEGNFERITPPELPEWGNWRIYPPKVSFEAEDEIGFKGAKSFEYILIPQSEDITEVPAFNYSTFDPISKSYKVAEIVAAPVEVEASELSGSIDTFIPDASGSRQEQRIPEKLLSLKPELGHYYPSGSILWKDPAFWIRNAMVGIVLFTFAFWRHRKNRLRTDHRLARRHAGGRKVRKAILAAQAAAKSKDPSKFYEQSRFAIQESICHLTNTPVEAKSLVTTDCLAILQEADVPNELFQSVAHFLGQADAYQFAGAVPSKDALLTLHKDLTSMISQLTRSTK